MSKPILLDDIPAGITHDVTTDMGKWASRTLKSTYPVIWVDVLPFKVRHNRGIELMAVYSVLGVTLDGQMEVMGLYYGPEESAAYEWLILSDLKVRGVRNIFIACVEDPHQGFGNAVKETFPATAVQLCLIHQLRRNTKFIAYKDLEHCVADLKKICNSRNAESALALLDQVAEKWSDYPGIFESWQINWNDIAAIFSYPPALRKILYMPGPVERYHRMLRAALITKGAFHFESIIARKAYLSALKYAQWQRQLFGWADVNKDLVKCFDDFGHTTRP